MPMQMMDLLIQLFLQGQPFISNSAQFEVIIGGASIMLHLLHHCLDSKGAILICLWHKALRTKALKAKVLRAKMLRA